MFKKLTAFFVMAVMVLSLAACGQQAAEEPAAPPDTLAKAQEAGKIVFGLDDAYPPMGYRDEANNLVGFDIDMAAELSKRLGVTFEPMPTAWDGVVPSLQSGKFDMIISGMSVTPEREEQIAFSVPYVKSGQVLVVKADNTDINSVENLAGKVVATQLGSSAQPIVEGFADLKDKKFYSAYPEAFTDLDIGRIDALVTDATVVPDYLTKQPGKYKVVANVAEENFAIGLRKEDATLKEALDKAIGEMQADGTLKAISEKWFGYDVTTF